MKLLRTSTQKVRISMCVYTRQESRETQKFKKKTAKKKTFLQRLEDVARCLRRRLTRKRCRKGKGISAPRVAKAKISRD